MNKKTFIIIGLQTLIIVVLFWMLVFYGKDEYEEVMAEEDENITSPSLVTTENGVTTVTLSPEVQKQSGITTTALQGIIHNAALTTFGIVVGIDGLVEGRARWLAARAEAEAARVALASSRQEYERMRLLNLDGRNVSDRAVALAEAALKSDQARLHASETTAQGIRETLRQQWGEVLADMALQQPIPQMLHDLTQRRNTLVQITLPIESATPAQDSILTIEAPGSPQPLQARFVSPAPQSESTIQGKTFYYLAPAEHLRTGMRVVARMSDPAKAQTGVIVPSRAVVWYANQPWVYRKQGTDKFLRIPIVTDTELAGGWFNTGELKAGDTVVTTGAQLLLSEEFKYQIKNENED